MEGTTKLIETYQNEDLMSLLRLMAPDKKGDDDNYPQIDFIIYLSKRDFPIGDILDINTYDIQGSNSTTDVTDSIESTTCDIETLRSLPQHPLDQMCFQISETNLSCDGFNKVLKVLPTYFDEYLITHLSASIHFFNVYETEIPLKDKVFFRAYQGLKEKDKERILNKKYITLPELTFKPEYIPPEINERVNDIESLVRKLGGKIERDLPFDTNEILQIPSEQWLTIKKGKQYSTTYYGHRILLERISKQTKELKIYDFDKDEKRIIEYKSSPYYEISVLKDDKLIREFISGDGTIQKLFDTAQVYTFSRFMKQRTNLKIKFSSGYIKDLKKNTKEEF